MLRFLRAITSRHTAPLHVASPVRRRCARCGRSFEPADEAGAELYCWWCSTRHATHAGDPLPDLHGE